VRKELASPAAAEPAKKKRGSGDKTRGAFGVAARKIFRRVTVRLPAIAYHRAATFLQDTLDWLNLWQDEPATDYNYDASGPEPPTTYTAQSFTSLHL
jgi:hypothetical protein